MKLTYSVHTCNTLSTSDPFTCQFQDNATHFEQKPTAVFDNNVKKTTYMLN